MKEPDFFPAYVKSYSEQDESFMDSLDSSQLIELSIYFAEYALNERRTTQNGSSYFCELELKEIIRCLKKAL